MAIVITDNYGLKSKRFLDDRNGATSLNDLKNWDENANPLPDGFEVCVAGIWYHYNSSNTINEITGKFRERVPGKNYVVGSVISDPADILDDYNND